MHTVSHLRFRFGWAKRRRVQRNCLCPISRLREEVAARVTTAEVSEPVEDLNEERKLTAHVKLDTAISWLTDEVGSRVAQP